MHFKLEIQNIVVLFGLYIIYFDIDCSLYPKSVLTYCRMCVDYIVGLTIQQLQETDLKRILALWIIVFIDCKLRFVFKLMGFI